jgi:membrane-bound lytic murein transglycosylase B
MRGFRRAAFVSLASVALLTSATTATASPRATSISPAFTASPAEQAQNRASRAKGRVDALLQQYEAASKQVNTGVHALAVAFDAGASAEVTDEEAAAQERRARAWQAEQIRAVYAAGGPTTLAASVLGAASPDAALWRVSTADRVLGGLFRNTQSQVTTRVGQARLARRRAKDTADATTAQAAALNALHTRAAVAEQALTAAQRTLKTLDARARQAKAAAQAAQLISAAQAAVRAERRSAMGPITALGIPAEYEKTYRAAARSCSGLRWTLLAAIGQVESGHGRNNGPSSAGAIGPMQFMPSTFASYAVDGDHDGVRDAWDPQDAIWTAARYLCATGAEGGSAPGVHAAVLAYNHAEWYVDLVLATEQAIIAREAALP